MVCTKIYNVRAQPLCCTLKRFVGAVLVAIAVVFLCKVSRGDDGRRRIFKLHLQILIFVDINDLLNNSDMRSG